MLPESAESIFITCHNNDQDGEQKIEPACHPGKEFPDIGELVKIICTEARNGYVQSGGNQNDQEKQNEMQKRS